MTTTTDHGYICKQCGDVAPMGIGYPSNEPAAIARSPETAECSCGYSRAPLSDRLEAVIAHIRLGDLVPILRAAGYGDQPEEAS